MKVFARSPLSIGVGACLWLGLAVAWQPALSSPEWPRLLVCLGAMVAVPAGLELVWRAQVFDLRLPVVPHGVAVACLAAAARTEPGALAAALSIPWLLCTLWVAWRAVTVWVSCFRSTPRRLAPALVGLAGPLLLSVGGLWAFTDRAGVTPLAFSPLIGLLTAAHFHFAGFVLPILAAATLAHWPGQPLWLRAATVGVIAAVPALALGITLSQGFESVRVEAAEAAAALALALCAAATAVAQFLFGWRAARADRTAGLLLCLSGVSLFGGMTLAAMYALRSVAPLSWLDLPCMWAWHGSLQVFGFALPGLAGWLRWVTSRPAAT